MVAQVVVIVADENVERHATEELPQVVARVRSQPSQPLRKVAIGITVSGDLVGFEHRERRLELDQRGNVKADMLAYASSNPKVTQFRWCWTPLLSTQTTP